MGVARVQPEAKTVNEGYKQLWNEDYTEYIWKVYPDIPFWKLRCREFRLVQSIYKKFKKPMNQSQVQSLLQGTSFNLI